MPMPAPPGGYSSPRSLASLFQSAARVPALIPGGGTNPGFGSIPGASSWRRGRRYPEYSPNHPYNLDRDDPNWRPYNFPGGKPRPSVYPPGHPDDRPGPDQTPGMLAWPDPEQPQKPPIPNSGPKHGGRDR